VPMSLELRWYDTVTLGEVADFVSTARAGGVKDETVLEFTGPDQDPTLHDGWRVDLPGAPEADSAELRLPASFARSMVELLNLVAESDGDVRGLQESVINTRDELLGALLKLIGS
jgi:hypothetical protein